MEFPQVPHRYSYRGTASQSTLVISPLVDNPVHNVVGKATSPRAAYEVIATAWLPRTPLR